MARPIEKREHIERGVVQVVAAKGLRGTTIQDIAGAAGVSPGLLYRYWKNRNDLAGEVYRRHLHEVLERIGSAASGHVGILDRLRAMVRSFLTLVDERPVVMRFLLFTQHELGDAVPADEGVRAFMRELIYDGVRTGVLRAMDPELALHFAFGIILQPTIGAMYGHVSRPLVQHHDEIMRTVERALVADNKATLRPDSATHTN